MLQMAMQRKLIREGTPLRGGLERWKQCENDQKDTGSTINCLVITLEMM